MEKEKPKRSLDEVLDKFDIFGRYHLRFMFFSGLAFATNSMYSPNYIFAAQEVEYTCKDEGFEKGQCRSVNSTVCMDWEYEDPNSFVAEYDLGCQDWKRLFVGTVHSFAYMVGLIFVGPMSDRLGRLRAMALTGMLGGVFGLGKSFSSYYWLYIVLEFFESAIGDSCSPLYVLNLEMVSARKRVIYYGFCSLGYVVGSLLYPLAAWAVPYWRDFLRVIYAPGLLLGFYVFILDESPRWLLIKGKTTKAIEVIKKIADTNHVKIDQDNLDKLVYEEDEKRIGFVELIKMTFASCTLFKRCMICIVWWTTSTFVNYGMMINSVSLQGNKYLNYALVSVIDIPGTFIVMYILKHFNRKNPLIVSFLVSAVLCFIQPFLPKEYPWLSIIIYMISKQVSSIYFSITYMYTSELFPTYTRNSMHALCSSLGRIGSIIAPQTPALMVYWSGLPSLFFGGASLFAGLLTFLVPDTGNNSLPDTVREAEEVGKELPRKMGIDNLAMTEDSVKLEYEGKEKDPKNLSFL